MKTEFLKELGLSEEQIKGVMAENGKDIAVEKDKSKTAAGELDGVKNQLTEANKTITELKKSNGTNEELQTKVKEYEKTIADHKAENVRLQRENAVKVALKDAGCTDVDYFMFKFKEKLEFDNNSPKNLESIITQEKENKSIMFTSGVSGNPPNDGVNNPPKDVTKMTYSEMVDYLEKNPGARL